MGERGNTAWARVGFVLAAALGACSGGSSSTADEVIEDTDDGAGDGDASGGDADGSAGDSGGEDPFECHPGHDPAEDELVHVGAEASGETSVRRVGASYELSFVGDETLVYEIDLADVAVQGGLLRVREQTTDAYPLYAGGPAFRKNDGDVVGPTALAATCTMIEARETPDGVEIDYEDAFDGVVRRRRHVFALRGKTLRVRVHSLDANELGFRQNYAGLVTGPTAATPEPEVVQMQGTLATPLVLFESAAGPAFLATMLDLTRSNASDFHLPTPPSVPDGASSIDFAYDTSGLYRQNTQGELSAPLDDTLTVVVTRFLADAFVTGSQPASPYRDRLATRTVAVLSGTAPWNDYSDHLNRLTALGVDDLAVHTFFWWTDSITEGTQNVGPDWAPAFDEDGFATFVAGAVERGMMVGAYTLFSSMPTTSPNFQPDDIVTDENGDMKTASYGSPVPLGAASDAALLDDVEREATALADYGLNLAFADASTYPAPSWPSDRIDQNAASPWPKTLRAAIRARKSWLTALQSGLDGPLLGEGSIFNANTSMEWLYSGYCDSVERTINTGAGQKAIYLDAGANDAPTTWPVIPDYELRVAQRQRADHGNAFYNRFFSPADGNEMVSGGSVVYPLSEAAADRYRIYELTYGHTSFFQTNGDEVDSGNYVRTAEMLNEYYLVSGLQEHSLLSAVEDIEYRSAGTWQTTQERLIAEGTTNAFRDPRLRISFTSGLVLYLNHSTNPWTVVLPQSVLEENTYVLPEDGFLAHRPGTDLLVLSGWTNTVAGDRFDFAHIPGRWTYFNGRGAVAEYGGLSTQLPGGGVHHQRIALHNFARELRVVQKANGEFVEEQGTAPSLLSVEVVPTTLELAPGGSACARAIAHFDNGARQDVSLLVDWTSTGDAAHVSAGGAVVACTPGTGTIGAADYAGIEVSAATVSVETP